MWTILIKATEALGMVYTNSNQQQTSVDACDTSKH